MKQKLLYILWGCLGVLCVGLGTLEFSDSLAQMAQILIALVFFLPGGILLYDALEAGDRKGILRIRWISILSLSLTLAALVAFILASARGSSAATWLYDVLILVSCPMVCGQYWLISLFLWACLLSATFAIKKDRK